MSCSIDWSYNLYCLAWSLWLSWAISCVYLKVRHSLTTSAAYTALSSGYKVSIIIRTITSWRTIIITSTCIRIWISDTIIILTDRKIRSGFTRWNSFITVSHTCGHIGVKIIISNCCRDTEWARVMLVNLQCWLSGAET